MLLGSCERFVGFGWEISQICGNLKWSESVGKTGKAQSLLQLSSVIFLKLSGVETLSVELI